MGGIERKFYTLTAIRVEQGFSPANEGILLTNWALAPEERPLSG
jgi:hypothetical protein